MWLFFDFFDLFWLFKFRKQALSNESFYKNSKQKIPATRPKASGMEGLVQSHQFFMGLDISQGNDDELFLHSKQMPLVRPPVN